MNIGLILAGGNGRRTEQDVPKQFMNVYEKPVILYTLEAFERHPDIDYILVVCLGGWEEILKAYARSDGITKLRWVVPGGDNGQQSTENGIRFLKDFCSEDDIIIVHDAIRPMVTQEILSDCIATCRRHGSGLSAIRCQETIIHTEDGKRGNRSIERSEIMRVQTPQAYPYGKLQWAYEEAEKRGITDEVYVNTLMIRLGEEVYFSVGSSKNVKITMLEDLEIFKALCKVSKEDWIK